MMKLRCITLCFCLTPFMAIAASDDFQNYRLWLENKTENQNNSAPLDTHIPFLPNALSIQINGKQYQINNNVDEMGRAIYIAINRGQYHDVKRLLPYYLALKNHDNALVNFAYAELAKNEKHYDLAIHYYQSILENNPDFLRIELELARVYYEDRQNKESLQLFNAILNKYQLNLTSSVIATIHKFITAIENRTQLTGSFSFGYGYNSNINQVPGNDKKMCQVIGDRIFCIGSGNVKAKTGTKIVYDGYLTKNIPLYKNNNLQLKLNTYGNKYIANGDYNENTTYARFNYLYTDANTSFALGPITEFKFVADQQRYYGVGINLDLEYQFSPRLSFNLAADSQKLIYRTPYNSSDGNKTNLYFTTIYALVPQFILFGGVDSSLVNKQINSDSYKQYGIRGGFFSEISPAFNLLAMATYKKSYFNEFDYSLNTQRKDNEQLYFIKLSSPKYTLMTLTPSISYKYRINNSSADFLYAYRQGELEIKLEKRF